MKNAHNTHDGFFRNVRCPSDIQRISSSLVGCVRLCALQCHRIGFVPGSMSASSSAHTKQRAARQMLRPISIQRQRRQYKIHISTIIIHTKIPFDMKMLFSHNTNWYDRETGWCVHGLTSLNGTHRVFRTCKYWPANANEWMNTENRSSEQRRPPFDSTESATTPNLCPKRNFCSNLVRFA